MAVSDAGRSHAKARPCPTGEQRAGLSALLPKAAAPEVSRRAKARIGAQSGCSETRSRGLGARAQQRGRAPRRVSRAKARSKLRRDPA